MNAALIQLVWERANQCCEYCQIHQDLDEFRFEVDHIISIKHDGPTAAENLALSCLHDNSHKGSDIAGLDPKTGKLTPLFNPRRQKWHSHFLWQGVHLLGRTPTGRVTVAVLKINDRIRLELREGLLEEGLFPFA